MHRTSRGRLRARTKEGGDNVDSEYGGGKYISEPMGICPVFKKRNLGAYIDTLCVCTESFAEKNILFLVRVKKTKELSL